VARARELLDLGLGNEVAVLPEFDLGQLEGVEAQLDLLAGEEGIDAGAIALERDRGGARDGAFLAPQERLAQQDRVGLPHDDLGQARLEAVERGLLGLGVDGAMVDELDPGLEGGVELVEGRDLCVLDLGEELRPDRSEEAGPKGTPLPRVLGV
jgi:hypothetical protein